MKNQLLWAIGGAARSKMRITISLSSAEAREALGFFRKTIEIKKWNPTVAEVLAEAKSDDADRNEERTTLADVLIEKGKVRPRFGIFVDGVNVESEEEGLNTRIGNRKDLVVIQVLGRVAGG
ncbi:MAG TPA: hypothetical protein VFF30_03785 [Nitrososphaerales archaeon]|nr:hypothetical protein [Nitrososphaerales archaeon]